MIETCGRYQADGWRAGGLGSIHSDSPDIDITADLGIYEPSLSGKCGLEDAVVRKG
jgi:hypothetical protein